MISPALFPFLLLMQAIPCDLNGDGKVNIADLQVMVNAILGVAACPAGQSGAGGLLTGTSVTTGPGPSRLYLSAGPAPANTISTDATGAVKTYDVVVYVDQVDGKLKLLTAAGAVVPLQIAFGPNMSTAGNLVDVNTATMLSQQTDQAGTPTTVKSSDGPTTYTGKMSPFLKEYDEGMFFRWIPAVACGAAPSLELEHLGPLPLMKLSAGALVPSDCAAGVPYFLAAHADPISHLIDAFVVR
jgi:hypothetical protein